MHEEGLALQVTSLIHVIEDFGNPFMDSGPKFVVLNSRECVNDEATSSVRQVEVLANYSMMSLRQTKLM